MKDKLVNDDSVLDARFNPDDYETIYDVPDIDNKYISFDTLLSWIDTLVAVQEKEESRCKE